MFIEVRNWPLFMKARNNDQHFETSQKEFHIILYKMQGLLVFFPQVLLFEELFDQMWRLRVKAQNVRAKKKQKCESSFYCRVPNKTLLM